MPIFSKKNKKILFVHIPKSGGSSIERIGADLGWSESFSIRGRDLNEIKHFKASLQHLHAKPLENLLKLNEFDSIFTVVRNPFSRLKSEYYWQRSQKITDLGVDEWIANTFEKYSYDSYIYDNHIRPQVEFVINHNNFKILKLEEDAVANSKEIFLSHSSDPKQVKLRVDSLLSLFRSERKEKRSAKDADIEKMFSNHYEKIVEFYKKDYLAFSYEV